MIFHSPYPRSFGMGEPEKPSNGDRHCGRRRREPTAFEKDNAQALSGSSDPRVKHSFPPCIERSPTFASSTRKLQRATIVAQGKACTVVYSADQPASHFAPVVPTPQAMPPKRLQRSVEDIIDLANSRGKSNIFSTIPVEIFLNIIEHLAPHSQAALALTSITVFRLIDSSCWTTLRPPGNRLESLNFLSLLDNDFRTSSRPLLLCSSCLAFHDWTNFDTRSQSQSPSTRLCELHYGKVHVAPHLHLSWRDIRRLAPDTSHETFATLQMHHYRDSPYQDYFVTQNLPYRHPRIKIDCTPAYACTYAHVTTSILKSSTAVCAETRWEFPSATTAAMEGRPRDVWDRLFEHPGWICPHNPVSAWWLSNYWAVGQGANKGSRPRMFCPMRCRLCPTDVEPAIEVLADGKPCLVVTTWRVLRQEDDSRSWEWVMQQPGAKTPDIEYGGLTIRVPKSGYLRPGGGIRDAFRGCKLSGREIELPELWSADEDGEYGVQMQSATYNYYGNKAWYGYMRYWGWRGLLRYWIDGRLPFLRSSAGMG